MRAEAAWGAHEDVSGFGAQHWPPVTSCAARLAGATIFASECAATTLRPSQLRSRLSRRWAARKQAHTSGTQRAGGPHAAANWGSAAQAVSAAAAALPSAAHCPGGALLLDPPLFRMDDLAAYATGALLALLLIRLLLGIIQWIARRGRQNVRTMVVLGSGEATGLHADGRLLLAGLRGGALCCSRVWRSVVCCPACLLPAVVSLLTTRTHPPCPSPAPCPSQAATPRK